MNNPIKNTSLTKEEEDQLIDIFINYEKGNKLEAINSYRYLFDISQMSMAKVYLELQIKEFNQ